MHARQPGDAHGYHDSTTARSRAAVVQRAARCRPTGARRRRTRCSAISAPTNPMARTGRWSTTSAGSSSIHRRRVASCRFRRSSGTANSTQIGRAARRRRQPARAGPRAPARRLRRTSCRPVDAGPRHRRAPRADGSGGRPRRGGGSGTSAAGRRAGRGRGSPGRAAPASPCRRVHRSPRRTGHR